MAAGWVAVRFVPKPRPLRKFLLQLFFAWQIELVFPGVDVGVFGSGQWVRQCLTHSLGVQRINVAAAPERTGATPMA